MTQTKEKVIKAIETTMPTVDVLIANLRILERPEGQDDAFLYESAITGMFKAACDAVGFEVANQAFDEADLNGDDTATREKWLLARSVMLKLGVEVGRNYA